MVDNQLYLGPETEQEAPKCKLPDSQSRAIDVLATKAFPPFEISSHAHYMTTPKELKEDVHKEIIDKDVCPRTPFFYVAGTTFC